MTWVDLGERLNISGVLFIYGKAKSHPKLLKWLSSDPSHFVVFIHVQQGGPTLDPFFHHPRVTCYERTLEVEALCSQIALDFSALKFFFAVNEESERSAAKEFFGALQKQLLSIQLITSDTQDLGAKVLGHLYENQRMAPNAFLGRSLKGAFSKIPAIVIGAGPSLDSQVDLLRSLQDKVLLIAGGSAVAALNCHHLNPHFSVHLDPDPPRSRFCLQDAYEIPHFYRSRLSPEVLEGIQGKLLWMPGSGSYPIEAWIQQEYGLEGDFYDGGWTVANFATAMAYDLGCDPIITLGMEFSHDQKIYAGDLKGLEHQETWTAAVTSDNKTVYTKKDWQMSAEWLSDFALSHKDVQMIHATPQGLEISGMEKRSLAEIPFTNMWDIQGLLHAKIGAAQKFPATLQQVAHVQSSMKESFLNAQNFVKELLSLWEQHYPGSPLEKEEYLLIKRQLESEMAYIYVFYPLWQVWKSSILRGNDHPLGAFLHQLLFFMRIVEENQSWMS